MNIKINAVIFIALCWGGLFSQALTFAQTEVPLEEWDKPIRPNLYENFEAFVSGCHMVDSPYSNGGAFTYGEKYILVWHSQTKGLLYSINSNFILIPSGVTFHGDTSEIPYTFESIGGMWSGLFFQDVFEFLNRGNFETLSEVSPRTLSEIADKSICNIDYKNLEKYIDWMGKPKEEKGEEDKEK